MTFPSDFSHKEVSRSTLSTRSFCDLWTCRKIGRIRVSGRTPLDQVALPLPGGPARRLDSQAGDIIASDRPNETRLDRIIRRAHEVAVESLAREAKEREARKRKETHVRPRAIAATIAQIVAQTDHPEQVSRISHHRSKPPSGYAPVKQRPDVDQKSEADSGIRVRRWAARSAPPGKWLEWSRAGHPPRDEILEQYRVDLYKRASVFLTHSHEERPFGRRRWPSDTDIAAQMDKLVEFDGALGRRFAELSELAERYFTVYGKTRRQSLTEIRRSCDTGGISRQ